MFAAADPKAIVEETDIMAAPATGVQVASKGFKVVPGRNDRTGEEVGEEINCSCI